VIKVNGNIDLNNANLTLSGPSNASFIIDVSGNLTLVGTASLLTSGVSDRNALYNFTGSNASINTHVGDVVNGVLLADGSSSQMTLDGTFNGELIGNDITLMSGAVVNSPPPIVPEAKSFVLLGTGAGVAGLIRFLRRRRLPVHES
jgi:hypothetical protein